MRDDCALFPFTTEGMDTIGFSTVLVRGDYSLPVAYRQRNNRMEHRVDCMSFKYEVLSVLSFCVRRWELERCLNLDGHYSDVGGGLEHQQPQTRRTRMPLAQIPPKTDLVATARADIPLLPPHTFTHPPTPHHLLLHIDQVVVAHLPRESVALSFGRSIPPAKEASSVVFLHLGGARLNQVYCARDPDQLLLYPLAFVVPRCNAFHSHLDQPICCLIVHYLTSLTHYSSRLILINYTPVGAGRSSSVMLQCEMA
eukprot:gene6103-4388_t